MKRGELLQVDPPGPTLTFQWNPASLVRTGRLARIEDIDRPGRTTAGEWDGTDPWRIGFTLRLDGYPNDPVHDQLSVLEGMAGLHRPTEPPPRLRLRYSGFSAVRYVIEQLEPGRELRRDDLAIVRIDVDLVLREWVEPALVASPAERERNRQQATPAATPAATSGRTHTIASGDTLWALSERYLGAGTRWQEIADANGIRDPRTLRVGATLRIPER